MAKKNKTMGWYYFADGTQAWFHGLSGAQKREMIRLHGAIIRFVPEG